MKWYTVKLERSQGRKKTYEALDDEYLADAEFNDLNGAFEAMVEFVSLRLDHLADARVQRDRSRSNVEAYIDLGHLNGEDLRVVVVPSSRSNPGHCPISGKYVPRSNPKAAIVLSPEGDEVRFCCPSHKTRYLRENPGSVEVNPVRVRESGDETYDSVATKIDGQRVVLTFFRSDSDDAPDHWNVALLVGATRKAKKAVRQRAEWPGQYEGRATGRVGLKALMWAKNQIDEFQKDRPEATVVVGSSDERRAGAYRALTRYGFKAGKYDGRNVMFRTPVRSNPGAVDLKGRAIPEKYLAGLTKAERRQRIAELTEQRDRKGSGDKRYEELASDRLARKKGLVKQSAYSIVAERRGIEIKYKGSKPDFQATARAALRYYGVNGNVRQIAALLEKSYDKGLKAWQTGGHRPGASQRNWGDARVNSLLVGGKTAWVASADRKQIRQFPYEMQAEIIRQMPEVLEALEAQGREKDIMYLEPKYEDAMEKLA